MLHAREARIRMYRVVPALPDALKPLMEIAKNLWWTWTPDAVALFCRLDPEAWAEHGHNPVRMLGFVSQERLEEAALDEAFLNEIYRVHSRLDQHCTCRTWFASKHAEVAGDTIAYFSAEFGLTECLRIYAGGLGVLAGDHLKSASELGIPLVGVGLLYQNGYFQQHLSPDGWQQESYPELDFANLPIDRVLTPDGEWLKVTIDMPFGQTYVGVWKVQVGRIPLYLLDTNVPENKPEAQAITRNLYGGDVETRIQQEIVLGIGGVRALTAMGIRPTICHINEGHAAFLSLERIRMAIEEHSISFREAIEYCGSSHVFTTHTPVPAGIDRFHPSLVEHYFRNYVGSLRLDMPGLLALGRENPMNQDDFFSMAILAINTCLWRNAVSALHGHVSRRMWRHIWPGVPEEEIPIGHVTNGTHTRSWVSRPMFSLFDRYLGYRWQHDPADHAVWERVEDIPDEELWAVRCQRRRTLITWARARIRTQMRLRGSSNEAIEQAAAALDPDAFTVGFARRFATYKRATLMLHDLERFMQLLNNPDRPVQFLIAGKAHPADSAGKELIRKLVHFAKSNGTGRTAGRVVFLENYDMNVARYLVTGCDMWLNTPQRGLEASGTSGMKAAMNGVINCSILDGWWDEAYRPEIGFSVGRRETYASDEEVDAVDSDSLYDLFENHILPEFYTRDQTDIPRRWIARIKNCIKTLAPVFNTNRMVQEYTNNLYMRALTLSKQLGADSLKGARGLAQQMERYRTLWHTVKIESVTTETKKPVAVRQPLPVEAIVYLGELSPDEVRVQAYTGTVSPLGDITDGSVIDLEYVDDQGNGRHKYFGSIKAQQSGQRGLSVRVIPHDERLPVAFIPGLITWDQPLPGNREQGSQSGDHLSDAAMGVSHHHAGHMSLKQPAHAGASGEGH